MEFGSDKYWLCGRPIASPAFSNDGRVVYAPIITWLPNPTAMVVAFDAETGRFKGQLPVPLRADDDIVAIDLLRSRMACVISSGRLITGDVERLSSVRDFGLPSNCDPKRLRGISLSRNGREVLLFSSARFWCVDALSGATLVESGGAFSDLATESAEVPSFARGGTPTIDAMAWSASGDILWAASSVGTLRAFAKETGDRARDLEIGVSPQSMKLSPGGDVCVLLSERGRKMTRVALSNGDAMTIEPGHRVSSFEFGQNEEELIAGAFDGAVMSVNLKNGEVRTIRSASPSKASRYGSVVELEQMFDIWGFSRPATYWVETSAFGRETRIVSIDGINSVEREKGEVGHASAGGIDCSHLGFDAAGQRLFARDPLGILYVFDVNKRRAVQQVRGERLSGSEYVTGYGGLWAMDRDRLSTTLDGAVTQITYRDDDLRRFQIMRQFDGLESVMALAYAADGESLVLSGATLVSTSDGIGERHSAVWVARMAEDKVDVKRAIMGELVGEMGSVCVATALPGGELTVLGTDNGRVVIVSATTGEFTRSWQAHEGHVSSVLRSVDGKTIITCSWDGQICAWSAQGEKRWQHDLDEDAALAATWSDNGCVAVGLSSGMVVSLEAESGTLVESWSAHAHACRAIAFSPKVQMLATGGSDGVIRLWKRTRE